MNPRKYDFDGLRRSSGVDKKQAAELLGVSTRTIENYASEGRINVTYVQGKNGKQAVYKENELRALKEELETPVYRSVVAANGSEIASSEVSGGFVPTTGASAVAPLGETPDARGLANATLYAKASPLGRRPHCSLEQIPLAQLLQIADSLPQLTPVARWLASNWVLQMAAVQQIVIIRSILLVLLDKDKLPRLKRFQSRGFEFMRVNDKSNEEWLVSILELR
ncbi:helix-turn-helix domain-containing protein [Nostoc sp. GT001]|uniref:helix-turn-helix domain-containing protein n=1 Tax=Nostoc sp. GT001 TaxID=3056647 RepID=UPI0025AB0DB2|nr:helix-turn-helix domain-containing protein [Nostoc sp. GT001]MDM9583135.1 helix-turn-helix domain-containing protein [Nostoc sp. GT001]